MQTIQHIALNCRDRRAQERFFTQHFGCKRARVFNAGRPDEFVLLRLGSVCLELFQAANPNATLRGGEQAIGFKHLAIEVSDLDAAVATLQADGINTEPIVDCSAIVKGMRVCFFTDREGNRLELMQGYADQ